MPVHQQKEPNTHFQVRDSAGKGEIKMETLGKMTELKVIRSMFKTKHLSKLTTCYHCKKGKLGIMHLRNKQYIKRCRRKGCQRANAVQAGNPVFYVGKGKVLPLKTQAKILHCAVWGQKQSLVPALLEDVRDPRPVQKIYIAWRKLVQQFVKSKQRSIRFGQRKGSVDKSVPLDETEWDEWSPRKQDRANHQVEWQEYVGGKRRGDRKSLVLEERPAKQSTSTRSSSGMASPPPMTKKEWTKIRDKRLGAGVLSHTDAAPAYKAQRSDTRHDACKHGRNKRGQKRQWTKATSHKDLANRTVKSVGGTQSLDGWWSQGKRATFGVKSSTPDHVDAHVRAEQWRHWVGAEDRWVASGEVFSWVPESA